MEIEHHEVCVMRAQIDVYMCGMIVTTAFSLHVIVLARAYKHFHLATRLTFTMNYIHAIPSVVHFHPNIADNQNINHQVFQGLFASKAAGDPLDPFAAASAESTVQLVSEAEGELLTSPLPNLIFF